MPGFDHKRITLGVTLDVLPAPGVLRHLQLHSQPDMRHWEEREQDWIRALPECQPEPDEDRCKQAVWDMVEEAIRVAGSKVIGSGRKPHQSREQKQLRSDATTLRR
eukprot:3514346-Rhodomonas_salina.1